MDLDRYRVSPGRRVRLSEWRTDDDGGLRKEDGEVWLSGLQQRLAELQERLYAESRQALLIVLQARDAGGKDGTVKQVIGAFNPNGVRVSNFKVPTEEERAHDFLWRVHAQTPRLGMIGVFNRSHYEDVLVTRIHRAISDQAAQERLTHIRAFEALLTSSGTRVVKFYLHISPEEQKKRLMARLQNPSKHWKFNPGDLQDRAKWAEYTAAYEDALTTSTSAAPWYIIPADRKWFRNLLVSLVLVQVLEDMKPQYPAPSFDPTAISLD
ncbi:PPK2 family polyphosphate kinase [Deinococcus sp. YIM 77859]|uniref:PPK2 family polyphosphate kinase n=1 Tax=Deinococcus sp. YIM 77859 TaxID=1540221 RepID=UPI00055300D9|nr:PPK2 family polyphosphate kinase [Deinococcus sp. YIM 77859]